MRVLTEGAGHDNSNKGAARRHGGSRAVALEAKRRWLTPGSVLACPCCGAELIELDAVGQAARKLRRIPFWQADTRRILVRCVACRHFHEVFAYPVFNWIPPARLTVE